MFIVITVLIIPIEYKYFLNRFIWHVDETLTGIKISNQSEAGSTGSEGVTLLTSEVLNRSLTMDTA